MRVILSVYLCVETSEQVYQERMSQRINHFECFLFCEKRFHSGFVANDVFFLESLDGEIFTITFVSGQDNLTKGAPTQARYYVEAVQADGGGDIVV